MHAMRFCSAGGAKISRGERATGRGDGRQHMADAENLAAAADLAAASSLLGVAGTPQPNRLVGAAAGCNWNSPQQINPVLSAELHEASWEKQDNGHVCKRCGGLKAGPSDTKKGCTCCSCKGCPSCKNNLGKKTWLPLRCSWDRIGRQSQRKMITKCQSCDSLARRGGRQQRRSTTQGGGRQQQSSTTQVAAQDVAQLGAEIAAELPFPPQPTSVPTDGGVVANPNPWAFTPTPEGDQQRNAEMHAEAGWFSQGLVPGSMPGDGDQASSIAVQEGQDGMGNHLVALDGSMPTPSQMDCHPPSPPACTSATVPWGLLQRPADPPLPGAPLSDDELRLWLQRSVLRTDQEFASQSIEFDADATLPSARIPIVSVLGGSMPGAKKYKVQNIGSTIEALLRLLGKVTWSGKHMGVLKESQKDGKRRFILFSTLLLYFEDKNDAEDLALCRVVVHRFTVVATHVIIGFRLPPAPHKLGIMLTQWGATDQTWHNDSLGVLDTYSGLLPLMNRSLDFERAGGGMHTMNMTVANDAEGTIFESPLKHRGTGAPLPEQLFGTRRSASASQPLPGFGMPLDGSASPPAVRIQSAALHYYAGKNAIRIPLSDKKAELAHHGHDA